MREWEKSPNGNLYLQADGFHISYLTPNALSVEARQSIEQFQVLSDILGGGNLACDEAGETALVRNGRYFILKGDWRREYEGLVDQGYEACLAFYKQNIQFKGDTSNEITD